MEMNSESPVEWVKDSADKYLYLFIIWMYIWHSFHCISESEAFT